jgi:DNA (cytosine-5)-methyltransferase 1
MINIDKYARKTFIENYGEPAYYPNNVYERAIPDQSLTLYVSSPPCQSFSKAGLRLGKDDLRGILFFNYYELIKKNKPRYFIFENVRGLLSDDGGKTFSEWCNMLGGKSVNAVPVLFPYEESVPYHLYWKTINAKNHGIPQNRDRVFLVGIRDDDDNNFRWPIEEHLTKRLKDVLEENVDEKYFLSEKMINGFLVHNEKHNEKGTSFIFTPKQENDVANCLRANGGLCPTDNTLKIKSAVSKGYEIAKDGDAVDFSIVTSTTRRGRVGKNVSHTLETKMKQAVVQYNNEIEIEKNTFNGYRIRRLTPRESFRLMDFPDHFTWSVSDSQAYKQAGNSICVGVLAKIINNLNL